VETAMTAEVLTATAATAASWHLEIQRRQTIHYTVKNNETKWLKSILFFAYLINILFIIYSRNIIHILFTLASWHLAVTVESSFLSVNLPYLINNKKVKHSRT